MLQYLAVIGFFIVAVLIFALGLHFSEYKKRKDAGCCGGGNCATDGTPGSCYNSKSKFVDDYISKISS